MDFILDDSTDTYFPLLIAVTNDDSAPLPSEGRTVVRLSQEQMTECKRIIALKMPEEYDEPHIQVEYDVDYRGGDYTEDGGSYDYVPQSLVMQFGAELAFYAHTGTSPIHIVYTNESEPIYDKDGNEVYDTDGTLLEEEEEEYDDG
jgi:hypothetical protein